MQITRARVALMTPRAAMVSRVPRMNLADEVEIFRLRRDIDQATLTDERRLRARLLEKGRRE